MKKKYSLPEYDKSQFVINPELSKRPMPISTEQEKNHKLLNGFLKIIRQNTQ